MTGFNRFHCFIQNETGLILASQCMKVVLMCNNNVISANEKLMRCSNGSRANILTNQES